MQAWRTFLKCVSGVSEQYQLDDLVLTGVSDAPPDVAFGAFETLDGTTDDLFTELVDFVLGPFGWN